MNCGDKTIKIGTYLAVPKRAPRMANIFGGFQAVEKV